MLGQTIGFNLTLCLGEVIRTIALEWRSITGGASGMTSIAPPNELSFGPLLSVKFGPTDKIPYYYLALFLLLVTLLVMHRIDKTRLGRSLRSIRQSDSLAAGIGINVARYKVIAFAIGSFFSGISGAFMPTYLGTVYPDHFNVWQSIYPVVHVTVGGLEHLFGPVVGTLFVTFIFEITRASPELQQLLYALILIVVIMLLPKGLTSLASQSLVWSAYIKRHLGGKNFGTA